MREREAAGPRISLTLNPGYKKIMTPTETIAQVPA
jgi:hypothetical protein